MKEITALNEVARHRPRSELVLGIQMENQQIRRLQAENRDLRMLIDEHQSAVDVIMTKYREQMALIVAAKNVNRNGDSRNANYLDNALRQKRGKIEGSRQETHERKRTSSGNAANLRNEEIPRRS